LTLAWLEAGSHAKSPMSMDQNLRKKISPLFHAALEIPKEERAEFISKACLGDDEAKAELIELLKANDQSTAVDDAPFASPKHGISAPSNSVYVGAVLMGRFRIVRHLGTGGMGDVFEAHDLQLGRIALKTIRPDIANSPNMLARFRGEVQIARLVSGPHVCRIHELFVYQEKKGSQVSAFITMEYLEGETLADRLSKSGPLPWREARTISVEICSGLQTIHQAGIIHRDLKSRNIMLSSRHGLNCVVLMDFGLAREIATPKTSSLAALTEPGVVVGTPNYMAPEQFEGRKLGPATDVYALGIVIYELVTGKHPFSSSSPIGAAILRGRRPCLASSVQRGLPRRLDEIICKCLEFEVERRYPSAKEVAEDLQNGAFSFVWLRKKWLRIVVGLFCLALAAASLLLNPSIRERVQGILFSSREKHIAVLPFDVVGDDPETVALGDGLMDSLTGKLSNLNAANRSLWVVPASEVRHRKVDNPSSALREFGATIAVKGKFERHDKSTHLTLTMIDTKKMRQIGFTDVENHEGNLAVMQDEAVSSLGRLMNISIGESFGSGNDVTGSPATYENYVLALGYIQRFDKPGNLDLAIGALENGVKTDPHFALGYARLAEVYILKYRLDANPRWLLEAQKHCKQAEQLDSRIPLVYVVLAQIQQHTGHNELAIQEFQHALDIDPRNAEALSGLASSYQDMGKGSDAETAYVKSAALRPDDWKGYNDLGIFYDLTGRHSEAITQFLHALELTPDNSGVYANLGAAYLSTGDPKMEEVAEQALRKSIAISPNYTAYANLGLLHIVQHRFKESIRESQQALKLNDQSYDIWDNLAEAYEWSGDKKEAEFARSRAKGLLENAIRLNAQDGYAHAALAVILAKEGMRDKATDQIHISLALSPDDQYVLSDVADAYELIGERRLAIQNLGQALHHGLPTEQLRGDLNLQGVLSDPNFQMPGK
jgi:Flp pilus assembly protein TadD/TolB-like protein